MSVTPLPSPQERPERSSGASSKRSARRGPTSTANFGSGRREAHDSSGFYERFVAPEISLDSKVNPAGELDVIHHGDARDMHGVATSSVALVVTSPPYFAGKQYEEELGVDGVPANYFEYLDLLRDVFAECKRVLEPGGRIAVNVANLGRRPYRSLSGDVTAVLSELGLLLRGEIVWLKGRAAGGSCAWGTFQRPSNPVLRDVTERIVIASKGRFDRALTPVQRAERGLPSTTSITRDEFMEATTDLWEIPPESARRVGHPAPFPAELPQRLIELYTYRDDVVLDPFMGSGSTAVAAVRTNRHYIGFDTDAGYVDLAQSRIAEERRELAERALAGRAYPATEIPAVADPEAGSGDDFETRAAREGLQARDYVGGLIEQCGFSNVTSGFKPRGLGVSFDFVAEDRSGNSWVFDVCGAFTTGAAGLRRSDVLMREIGKAAVLATGNGDHRLVVVTTDLPVTGSPGDRALRAVRGEAGQVYDVIEIFDPCIRERLESYASR